MLEGHEGLVIAATVLTASAAVSPACSSAGDPTPDGPPVCEFCDEGEQELKCRIAVYKDGILYGGISDAAYVCLAPAATDEEQAQACIDSCEAYIADGEPGLECQFQDEDEPFYWTGCVPPGGTAGGAGAALECPEWYTPTTHIHGYQQGKSSATVTIDRGFLDALRADPLALHVCDDARYVDHGAYWMFERVDAGESLFELGIREGDRNAVVRGVDPRTLEPTTPALALDSIEHMVVAYESLAAAKGVELTVERPGIEEPWVIWVSIE